MMVISTDKEDEAEERLNVIVSNNAAYFDMLFDLLNLGNSDITSAVWSLLMQVPVNQKLLQKIKQLADIRPMEIPDDAYEGWAEIVDPASTYKMLYSLQILNTMISAQDGEA
jgi:hypothetical protein